jgi:hypothetical protein
MASPGLRDFDANPASRQMESAIKPADPGPLRTDRIDFGMGRRVIRVDSNVAAPKVRAPISRLSWSGTRSRPAAAARPVPADGPARGKLSKIATVAVARELAGFVWGVLTARWA